MHFFPLLVLLAPSPLPSSSSLSSSSSFYPLFILLVFVITETSGAHPAQPPHSPHHPSQRRQHQCLRAAYGPSNQATSFYEMFWVLNPSSFYLTLQLLMFTFHRLSKVSTVISFKKKSDGLPSSESPKHGESQTQETPPDAHPPASPEQEPR